MKFSGFCFKGERYADNREFYRQILESDADPVEKERARSSLLFLEKFKPDEPHDRLVAHRITIFGFSDLSWRNVGHKKWSAHAEGIWKSGEGPVQLWLPVGRQERIAQLDLGTMVWEALGKIAEFKPEIIDEQTSIHLENGTEVRGQKIRTNPYPGSVGARIIPSEYLKIEFDDGMAGGGFMYTTELPLNTPNQPRAYVVETYVTVDSVEIERQREMLTPVFRGGHLPPPSRLSSYRRQRKVITGNPVAY